MDKPIYSHPINIATIPATGTHVHLDLDQNVREAVAAGYGLVAVTELVADLEVRPWAKDGFEVTGRITADIVQTCSVTLDPFNAQIDEPVSIRFSPHATEQRTRRSADSEDEEEGTDLDAPDPLTGSSIDLGAVVLEFFALGLDPYPRKPGVTFQDYIEDEGRENPFKALASLGKRDRSA